MVNFKGFFSSKNQSIRRKFSSENKSLRFLYKVHFILHSALQKKRFLHFQSNDDDLHDDIIPTRWIPDYIRVFKSVKLFVILKFVQSANAVNFKHF